jgi:hypothetical protein
MARMRNLPVVQTQSASARAARSLGVTTRGGESGTFVCASRNGFGRPSPRSHQPSSVGRRRATRPNERTRRRRVRPQRSGRRVLEEPAERRAEHVIPGAAVGAMIHHGMNKANNRKARAGRVGDRGPATIGVPAEHPAREVQAADGVRACRKCHATGRHVEDVCSARAVQHVRPPKKARERLTIAAVADEAEAPIGRHDVSYAAHMPAPAAERNSVVRCRHDRLRYAPVTRQMTSPTSSATKREPSRASVTPTGRP